MSVSRFLAMVGALIRSPDGRYLVLRRSPTKDFAAGAWECVTGRVDQGESFSQAVLREIQEELGVKATIEYLVGTAHFYRGEATAENEMLGVLYACSVANPGIIRTSAEHAEYHWLSPAEAEAAFPATYWLGRAIRRAEAIRALLSPELLEFYSLNQFEL